MSSVDSSHMLKGIIDAADRLPPFPDIIWKVIPLVRDMAPVSEIESVIRFDPAITARVIALSQTPYYARRRKIACLRDAIIALGEQQLMMVVLTACSARYFANEEGGYDLREGELWEHAVAVALMAELVGRRIGLKNILTPYTAALLHDIGKTVMSFYVGSCFDTIFKTAREKGIPFLEAERHLLGVDHQHLGAMIAAKWNFPKDVVSAIGNHHNPLESNEHKDLAALIYIANRMVTALGIGCGADGLLQQNEDLVFVRMGINTHMMEQCMADLMEALDDTREFLAAS